MEIREISFSKNALAVLERRYLRKDQEGHIIETPTELFVRVANCIAEADRAYGADDTAVEQTAQSFFDLMASFEFIPNSPTLMNAGRESGQLSACFVLPVDDSMEEIFETNKHAALIHKSGGGTGFSFSRLRPRNSIVASTSGVASGPVSFMKVYDASTYAVRQGGTRRGANMGILRVDHPDILEFISCKENTSEITNFNISVAITDNFMQALKNNGSYSLIDPRTGTPYSINKKEMKLSANEVFDKIVKQAWGTGEPGIIFIDRMNQKNPTSPSETIEATNPCGEQPLPPYDSCNLGSINLGRFVPDQLPDNYTIESADNLIDWTRLAQTVHTAVHFLDNVIDQNSYPIEEIDNQSKRNRRIGLGVMGWADMLVKLRFAYDSEQAMALAEKVMSFVHSEACKQSSELAKIRGRFPNWEGSVYAQQNISMRNATVTTVAPTGTISIIASCSSGIEPYFAIAFTRNVLDGTKLTEMNPFFEKLLSGEEYYTPELVQEITSCQSLSSISVIPDHIKLLFKTASDISPEDHVRMQAQFQKHCDSSVSKTINLPETATVDDVRTAFILSYELGCKGVTIYRNNSRPNQVLSTDEKAERRAVAMQERPEILSGFTEKVRTGYGNLYVTVNIKDNLPFEVFAHIGKSGYTTMADTEAICRLISLSLRSGLSVDDVIKQLRGIGGSSQTFSNGARIHSIPDAIAQILYRHFGSKQSESKPTIDGLEVCPECHGAMILSSGCFSCPSCGYSTC